MTENSGARAKRSFSAFFKNNRGIILPAILFCFPVLLYLHTVGFGFSYFDDHDLILNKIALLRDAGNAPRAFVTDASLVGSSGFYRPLQNVSYMADIQLSGGNNPWMYHLTNVLLTGLTAAVLFVFLRKLSLPEKTAFLATILYSAHPLFAMFTAWIPSRGDLLLTLFSLLSFIFFMEHLRRKKAVHVILHWLAFTAALFCKETALALLFLFALYYFAFSPERRFEKRHLLNVALYAISGTIWFLLRSVAVAHSSTEAIGLPALLSNLRTIPESLSNFFLPFHIALIPSFSLMKTLTGSAILILLIALFFIDKQGSRKKKFFFLSWFLLFTLPALLYKEGFIDYLNHRFFLPLIGILLFVLEVIPKKWLAEKDLKRKIIVNGAAVGALAVLSAFTVVDARSFSDPMTFWNASVSQNPHNALNYVNRGYVRLMVDDVQGAIDDYTKAIALNPSFSPAYYNLGNAYMAGGNPATAVTNYDQAIRLNPDNPDFYYNRGNAFAAKGDPESAIRDYRKAIEVYPRYAEAYNNLGLAYQAQGDPDRALGEYNKAIEYHPGLSEAYYNRGNLHLDRGSLDNAVRDFLKAVDLTPDYAEAYNNLGLAYQALGNLNGALACYDKAVALKPGLAEAYYNRGNARLLQRDFQRAVQEYDKAVELRPDYAQAYGIRGIAYAEAGDLDSAIRDYRKAIELNPGDANAYGNLGNAYKAKGMLREAEKSFKMYEQLTGRK